MLKHITKFLEKLADWTNRFPKRIIIFQLILAVTCMVYTIQCLLFTTDRNILVGDDKKYQKIFLKYQEDFPCQDDIVAVVESDDFEKNRMFVEILGDKLKKEPELFTDILYCNDLKMMGNKALLFAETEILHDLEIELKNYAPFITQFTEATNLTSLFSYINNRFVQAENEDTQENRNMIKTLPALNRILQGAYKTISRPGIPLAPGLEALFGSGEEAENGQYITFNNGKMYVVNLHITSDDVKEKAVERLKQLVEDVKMEVGGVNVGITGEPVLEAAEMSQSQSDTTLSSIVSIFLCLLIFCYGYRNFHRPLAAISCLVIGLIFTMGWTTLAVGRLNLLTITFLPMLIGLGIDFGVHLVSRFEEELNNGQNIRQAMKLSLVNTGMGIFTGGIATAGAFLAMGFGHFQGVKEMGIISGGGLIICLLPMMTILPILLMKGASLQKKKKVIIHKPYIRNYLEKIWRKVPVPMLLISLLFTILSLALAFPRIYFDYNLLNMQSKSLPAVELERSLIDSAGNSIIYGIALADTEAEALRLQTEFEKLTNVVASVQSAAHFMGSGDIQEKLATIGRIKEIVKPIQIREPELEKVNIDALDKQLHRLQGYITFAINAVKNEPDEEELLRHLGELKETIITLRLQFLKGEREYIERRLGFYQHAFFNDVAKTFNAIKTQDNSGPLKPDDLPLALRHRFIGKSGTYAVEVFPTKDVWERDNQEEFVKAIRTVDPNVTGSPVQLYEYTSLLKNSYIEAAWYSLAAIVLLLFLRFHRPLYVLLAMIPVGIGMIWLVGCMVLCDVPFNPANIMTVPMTVGVGVSGGIQILNRYLEEGKTVVFANSTGLAVIISALTTIAGFGSLMLGKHQGIQSLGFVMGIGTLMCMIAALTLLPALMMILERRGWLKK